MEWIILKPKEASPADHNIHVADEVIPGLLRAGFWMIEASGALCTVESFIENFLWPRKVGEDIPRVVAFLRGNNPDLVSKIEYYEA